LGTTEEKPGHYLADIVHDQLEAVHHRHSSIKLALAWTPGHAGIEGNQHPDEEAKRAVLSESSPQRYLPKACSKALPVSRSAAHQHNAKTTKTKAKK